VGLTFDRWTDRVRDWTDRVAPGAEPFAACGVNIDQILTDATEIARTAVECAVEPLRDLLADLPRVITMEFRGRARTWADPDGWDI
jgi:hypothetical protein